MKTKPKRRHDSNPRAPSGKRTFDSMAQAAGMLGLPLVVLRGAKSQGCPAFRSNRVFEEPLMEWLRTHKQSGDAPADMPQAKLAVVLEQARKLKLANDQREGSLVKRSDVLAHLTEYTGGQKAILRQRLENELPVAGAHLEPAQLRVLCKRYVDEICRDHQRLVEKWTI